jgi:voltage-gated potassium channel
MELGDRRERRRALHQLEAWIETPMIILSFVWLGLFLAELLWGTAWPMTVIVTIIWLVFIGEFVLRLTLTPDKTTFLRRNLLTIIALIVPAFRAFAALRFIRVARAARGLRLIRVVATANRGMNALRRSMRRRGLGYVLLLTLSIALLGAGGMLALEPSPEVEGGFRTYWDALWWTAMLLTTIGTDFWPRTMEGRMLCFLLATYAFGVWGYITASLASFFIGQEAISRRS